MMGSMRTFVKDGLTDRAGFIRTLWALKMFQKKDLSDVSLDDKTGLCSIATGRTNDIVRILRELRKLIIQSLGPC